MNHSLVIIAATIVLLIFSLSIHRAVFGPYKIGMGKEEAVCSTSGCMEAASKVLKYINSKTEPCDNFYDFACGGYLASTSIPDGQISVDCTSPLVEKIENQLRLSIEEPSTPDEARPFKLAKTFYKTCMNTSAIEEAGLKPLRKILRKFGNWPVIEGDNWKGDFDWVESVYMARKLGYSRNSFITLAINVDWTNATNYMLVLDQPEFGVSRESLMKGVEYFVVKAYYDYMVDIAVLFGANKQRATQELKESLEFEIKLANITLSKSERRNYALLYNPMTIAELERRFPSVNWEQYINALLPQTIRVNADEVVSVKEPNFVRDLDKLVKNTPKRIQANYALWRVVAESVKYLTKDLRNREMEFNAVKNNVKTTENPRWKECMSIIVKSAMSISTNALYVRKYVKEEARQDVVEMVNDIKNELIKTLEKVDWMDVKTRRRAVEKAVSMISLVAYPVELLDDKKLEKLYADLTITADDFHGNILDLKLWESSYEPQMLRKPVNRSDWVIHDYSTKVNAFYAPAENSIHIPAGVLQGMFYSHDRPRYMNYGAVGFLIGHEMTHGFDNRNRQFDKDANLVDWWMPETASKYFQKAQCMINQYNSYTSESATMHFDGINTLGENIADNGGIQKAYHAYKEYVKRNGPEPRLPGLKYTPEQLFWISAASIWCTRYRPDIHLATGIHSPARFRVIGAFSNAPEFAADFNCPVDSYMNPLNKCSVL